ncbi:MAG: hypothetical protein IT376_12865 [Polyangiaceae bacterium]|nr:hypothetical protein [Polyangiaceae bacterium]
MKTLRRFALALSALSALALLPSCELQNCDEGEEENADGVCVQAKSLKRFEGSLETKEAFWVSGGAVTIDGTNGDIEVKSGIAGKVVAKFKRHILRAYDTPEATIVEDLGKLVTTVEGDVGGVGSGSSLVKTHREDGAYSTLGADITVELPPDFDGVLRVLQNNGQTAVYFVGSARGIEVVSENGGCEVSGGTSAASIVVACDNGGVAAKVGGVPAGATGSFTSGNGDLDLEISQSSKFSVQATASGIVDTSAAPSGCVVQEAAPNSKTVSCNGATAADPVLQATAENGDVVLTF